MFWNYRVVYREDEATHTGFYSVYEVYYSKKGKIKAWTATAVEPYGESTRELKQDLKMMKQALKKPVLIEKKKGDKMILKERKNK